MIALGAGHIEAGHWSADPGSGKPAWDRNGVSAAQATARMGWRCSSLRLGTGQQRCLPWPVPCRG